jgi:hypothetical protein
MSKIELHTHRNSINFTIVPNHIIENNDLKLEDRGLLIWLLSRPASWSLNIKSLCTIHKVSIDRITAICKRLKNAKHLFIEKFSSGLTKWHIFERSNDFDNAIKPDPENQNEAIKKPDSEKPNEENQNALTNTDLITRTKEPLTREITISNNSDYPDFQVDPLPEQVPEEYLHIANISGFTGDVQKVYFKFIGYLQANCKADFNYSRKIGEWRQYIGREKAHTKRPSFNQPSKVQALDLDDQTWAEGLRLKL